jgi:hypothetical protein
LEKRKGADALATAALPYQTNGLALVDIIRNPVHSLDQTVIGKKMGAKIFNFQ